MQTTTREWIHKTVDQLKDREAEQLKDYLEFLTWKSKQQESKEKPEKTQAQRIIEVMEKPPHLTHEDVEALRQAIEEGKMPVKYDSPFEQGEPEGK